MPNKRYTFIAVAFVLIATPILFAFQQGFGRPPFGGPGGPGAQKKTEVLERFDADQNGWLNKDERTKALEYLKDDTGGFGIFGDDPEFGGGRGRRGGGPGGGFGRPGGRGGPGGQRERVSAKPGDAISPDDVKPEDESKKLYDPNTLRTIFIEFENKNWESELESFHDTDADVPATLTVDGKKYPLVGIRFRGMSSYGMVPAGFKRSFNVSLNMVNKDQRLLGYKTLNLLNCSGDDTMMSSVLYSHLISKHTIAPKANFVRVVVNGENWGVYTNAQQFNKDLLREHYDSAKGTRWKVSGSPRGGGGLDYRGQDESNYGHPYLMKDGKKKSLAKLIELCRIMDEVPPNELASKIEPIVDIDELLWFLAYDNALCNSDGYWVRASDYSIFLDKKNVFHFLPHDMNEAFRSPNGGGGGPGGGRRPRGLFDFLGRNDQPSDSNERNSLNGLDPLIGLDDQSKPLRSKILAVPKYKKQYMENIRTIANELKWENLGPIVKQYRDLIKDEVKRDTRKLGTYESFLAMTSNDAPKTSDGPRNARGPGGHGAMNLRQFSEVRSNYLISVTDEFFADEPSKNDGLSDEATESR